MTIISKWESEVKIFSQELGEKWFIPIGEKSKNGAISPRMTLKNI
jgi:hypothetical protein